MLLYGRQKEGWTLDCFKIKKNKEEEIEFNLKESLISSVYFLIKFAIKRCAVKSYINLFYILL